MTSSSEATGAAARRRMPLRQGGAWLLLTGWPLWSLAQGGAPVPSPPAWAASGVGAGTATLELATRVVVGARASLATAQQVKRDAIEIVDAVVADDINKLPDLSVTDALQRITGVQIARDRGEGTTTAIRGLTQMETTLNGREIFSAGTGRNLEFADIPAEMVSAIHVYKTSSASQIEGGIGGSVDLRTRRPFDFAGRESVVSLRRIDSRLAQAGANQVSLLWSDRWQTTRGGEFGVLLNVSRQDRAWREDQKSSGSPVAHRGDASDPNNVVLIPGQTVYAAGSTSETTSVGRRERTGVSAVLQWRPDDRLELYAEAAYAQFDTRQDSYQINVSGSKTFVPGSVALFPGTADVRRITWTNAPVSILSFARDTIDRTRSMALGGSWRADPGWTVKADLSQARGYNNLYFSGPVLGATAANFTQDVSGSVPTTRIAGTDLLDPRQFAVSTITYRTRPFDGRLTAGRIDLERQFEGGAIEALEAGLRQARRQATNTPGLIFADAAVSGISAADPPGFALPNPYGNFLGSGASNNIANYIVGNIDQARDAAAYRSAFGITAPIPATGNPLSLWTIRERTDAGYASLRFKAAPWPIDGHVGLRIVRTDESVEGSQAVPATGGVAPIAVSSTYTDVLPSLNLRYPFAPGWQLRAAASKTVTRPNFDQLSPSLNLVRNSIDPTLNQGSAGNPALAPVRSRNLDVALEGYFGPTTSVHLTGFVKRVEGFVQNFIKGELHDGQTYQVSRPYNAPTADIQGVELGYQQFFGFLPGVWRGLGVQANTTYVDGHSCTPATDVCQALQNLSRHSYNLIGLYELGPVSARVAYNWRSRFVTGFFNAADTGPTPITTRAYGWLDASLRWRVNPTLTLALEGNNLLNTRRSAYYGVPTRPQSAWINDVQIGVGASLRY